MPRPVELAITTVCVIVVGIAVYSFWPRDSCGPGLRSEGTTCIGVTMGQDLHDPLVADVLSKIRSENDSVTGDFYTVGYLVPLEPPDARTSLSAELQHELQGVHLLQLRANRTAEIEGGAPKIKIAIGNAGPKNAFWSEVVAAFQDLEAGPERLRAVAGFGNSIEETKRAIAGLTGGIDADDPEVRHPQIAAVGSRLTADSLSFDPVQRRIDGFLRVAPTNTDEAIAATMALQESNFTRPLLVRDTNPTDDYARTLGEAYRSNLAGPAEETFDSSKDDAGGALASIVNVACSGQPPDVIYFGARGDLLTVFVELLGDSMCGTGLTIVTGDDVAGLRDAVQGGNQGVQTALKIHKVFYSALAHPLAWDGAADGAYGRAALDHFRPECQGPACFTDVFPQGQLDDGAAIMGHDAALLAVTAIRRASRGPNGVTKEATSSAVIQLAYRIRGAESILGASGVLTMSPCGDATDKSFPVLSLLQDGTVELIARAISTARLAC